MIKLTVVINFIFSPYCWCFVAAEVTTTVPGNLVIDSVTRDECVNNGYEDPNSAGNMQVRGAVSRTVSLVL